MNMYLDEPGVFDKDYNNYFNFGSLILLKTKDKENLQGTFSKMGSPF